MKYNTFQIDEEGKNLLNPQEWSLDEGKKAQSKRMIIIIGLLLGFGIFASLFFLPTSCSSQLESSLQASPVTPRNSRSLIFTTSDNHEDVLSQLRQHLDSNDLTAVFPRIKYSHLKDRKTVFRVQDHPKRLDAVHQFLIDNNIPVVYYGGDRLKHHSLRLDDDYVAPYFASDISKIYEFPRPSEMLSLPPVTVGVIGLEGPVDIDSIKEYWRKNCDIPDSSHPTIVNVPVHDLSEINSRGVSDESTIDVSIVGAVAPFPNLTIVVYVTSNSSIASFIDAVAAAALDDKHHPTIITTSWGISERIVGSDFVHGTDEIFEILRNDFGITIVAASGDEAASDGLNDGRPHVNFPASSPNVVGVGGTTLYSDAKETFWSYDFEQNSGSGGGYSEYFTKPKFQTQNLGQSRSVPDVVMDGDPYTGVKFPFNGRLISRGGTSVASPLFAGLLSIANYKGNTLERMYSQSHTFKPFFAATNGFYSDPKVLTGLGVPNVKEFLAAFKNGN